MSYAYGKKADATDTSHLPDGWGGDAWPSNWPTYPPGWIWTGGAPFPSGTDHEDYEAHAGMPSDYEGLIWPGSILTMEFSASAAAAIETVTQDASAVFALSVTAAGEVWEPVEPTLYTDGNGKSLLEKEGLQSPGGPGDWSGSKSGAIIDAWSRVTGATATAVADSENQRGFDGDATANGDCTAWFARMTLSKVFFYFDIPGGQGVTKVEIRIGTSNSLDGEQWPTAWKWHVCVGLNGASPGTLDASKWSWGSQPTEVSAAKATPAVGDYTEWTTLDHWTAGKTNYIQVAPEEVTPSDMADSMTCEDYYHVPSYKAFYATPSIEVRYT